MKTKAFPFTFKVRWPHGKSSVVSGQDRPRSRRAASSGFFGFFPADMTAASMRPSRAMRKSNVVAFVLSSLAVGLILACGSDPKPNVPTTPSATPTTTASATPLPDATGTTASTGDAGGGGGGADAGPTKEQQCETLQSDAQAEMDAERIKVDKTCKKDADCMPIKGRACQFIC